MGKMVFLWALLKLFLTFKEARCGEEFTEDFRL